METDRKALLFYNEDWKKDTHRKELREGGREEGEAIGLGPVLLAGNTDEEITCAWDLPWGVSGSNHILGTPDLGSDLGKMNPLGWLEDQ